MSYYTCLQSYYMCCAVPRVLLYVPVFPPESISHIATRLNFFAQVCYQVYFPLGAVSQYHKLSGLSKQPLTGPHSCFPGSSFPHKGTQHGCQVGCAFTSTGNQKQAAKNVPDSSSISSYWPTSLTFNSLSDLTQTVRCGLVHVWAPRKPTDAIGSGLVKGWCSAAIN